jgi:hypothetical protein
MLAKAFLATVNRTDFVAALKKPPATQMSRLTWRKTAAPLAKDPETMFGGIED